MDEIKQFLEKNVDEGNALFSGKLTHTKYKIVGTKIKKCEEFAKNLVKEGKAPQFVHISSHEEILILGFMIAYSRIETQQKIEQLKQLLPFIDNWATCDSIIPRLKGLEKEKDFFVSLLSYDNPFYQRVGIIWLKRFVLKEKVKDTIKFLDGVKSQNYYVKMALAWTFQEALIYDFDFMYDYISSLNDDFIKRKTISKAVDSFRINAKQKEKLKELRAGAKYRLEKTD